MPPLNAFMHEKCGPMTLCLDWFRLTAWHAVMRQPGTYILSGEVGRMHKWYTGIANRLHVDSVEINQRRQMTSSIIGLICKVVSTGSFHALTRASDSIPYRTIESNSGFVRFSDFLVHDYSRKSGKNVHASLNPNNRHPRRGSPALPIQKPLCQSETLFIENGLPDFLDLSPS